MKKFTMPKMFLIFSALAACAAASCAYGGVPKYSDELRDHCWLWGHETGQVDGTNNYWSLDIARSYYHMVDAARDVGIHNLNAIRWDKPDKSFRDSLKPLKRVTWPISGNKTEKNFTYDALADWCFAAADEMPNVTGFDLDDFFIARGKSVTVQTAAGPALSCPTRFPYEQLVELRKRLSAYPRPLELRVVVYDDLLDKRENPGDLKPSLDLVDAVTYWTWRAKDIPRIPEHLARLRKLAPGKPVYLGIYLWDFGSHKEMPLELMEMQLKFALDGWKDGTLEGFVFLCSSICNRPYPAVIAARKWISEHGSLRREPCCSKTGRSHYVERASN